MKRLAAAVAIAGLILAGCAQQQETSSKPQEVCKNPQLDLKETDLGVHLASGQRVPLIKDGQKTQELYYFVDVKENEFDPCAPLSYVKFQGGRGDLNNANLGIGPTETVIFFHYGKMIPNQEPRFYYEISDVNLADKTIKIGAERKENSFEIARYEQLPLEISSESVKHPEIHTSHGDYKLDLKRSNPPSDMGNDLPMGNANFKSWDEKLEPQTYLFTVPMDKNTTLKCHISRERTIGFMCDTSLSPNSSLPAADTGPIKQNQPLDPQGRANQVAINFASPSSAVSAYYSPGKMQHKYEVADEKVTKMRDYLVDTRGDSVVFSNGSVAFKVSAESIEEAKDVPTLDTSQWPKLEPFF